MFRLFFEGLVHPQVGLFESAASTTTANRGGSGGGGGRLFLPIAGRGLSAAVKGRFKAVGRAMVKSFYEGKRIGNR